MSAALVFNPRAGQILRNRTRFDKAVGILRETWPDIRLIETKGPGTAGRLARAAVEEGAAFVIVCGGDGTINEVAQSLAGTHIPIGILPGGTANVLAKEIWLGNDMLAAARSLSDAEPHDVATGILRREEEITHFILMAGIGFDALVVHELDLERKDRWGKGAYWGGAFRQIGRRLELFDATVNGETYRCSFALVSKVRNYGGSVWIARDASLLKDEFEVILFETTSVLRLAWLFATGVITGTLHKKRDVRVVKASRVSLKSVSPEIHVQVDGEYAGKLPVEIELVPDSIRLLLPRAWLRLERTRLASE